MRRKDPARATKDAPWENSLEMRFVPVPGTEVLFSIWETRVKDFEAFVKDGEGNGGYDYRQGSEPVESNGEQLGWDYGWDKPGFPQSGDHPVTCVSWEDAKAYCEWLTRRERAEGRIGSAQSYRLPADWEWSVAVGLKESRSGTPKAKDEKIQGVYPWGTQWPPPRGAGNYASFLKVDDYERTSPVGSFAANRHGLYDLGGNVWEWCEDYHDGRGDNRVLRGACWVSGGARSLLSSGRLSRNPFVRNDFDGFRCVLVGGSAAR